eukprot:TRINITY_DN2420_c0_g1_i1.p1 TRINITY_DN2420_c0_g1~~TRINITY_DN2420_c0_g1_i1.p1  ORF type:complete len:694 (+),score=179.10 TRINITY_DN2420_c0_g1_i1:67-2082(+)
MATQEAEKPEFIEERIKFFEQVKAQQAAAAAETPIKITLPDGSVKEGIAWKTTPYDVAMGIAKGLAQNTVAAKVNDVVWDAMRPLEGDCTLHLLKFDSPEGKHVFWHSSAHILGQALELEYGAKLCIGPALEEGFYYDSALDKDVISEAAYERIQKRADKIISEAQPFERLFIPKEVALEMFKYNKYKSEIIRNKVPDGQSCSVYRCGPLIDLCKGPHLPSTAMVKAFKVTKNSSAYWLGKAENDSLQRVYGVSFPDKKLMKEWELRVEEAKKRDHRVIGRDQQLFFFHELSPGSCFFLPHGARIYNTLMDFIRGQYRLRGYTEVVTPNMFNVKLWETSGHYANYRENMFQFEIEGQPFALKPMNCPGHCLMFGSRARSYRELPIRYADFGVLHRNELSGALTGLTRVRRFCQDDAHIFCTPDQVQSEIAGALDFLKFVYGVFGFTFTLALSTRPDNFLGDPEQWDAAEKALEAALNQFGQKWSVKPKDGAFYGPKIDIGIMDAMGRSHQCATIQLDFQLPQRFKLEYETGTTAKGCPVIVHRAMLGSVERMIAILTENFAGRWPLWLSPRQVCVVTLNDKVREYGEAVVAQLHAAGLFVEGDFSGDKLEKKVAMAQTQQFNYILAIGGKEAEHQTVNLRNARADKASAVIGERRVEEVIALLKAEIAEYK